MSDYDHDIVMRLRNYYTTTFDLSTKAADEIERLRAEVERLRAQRDDARRMYLASTYSDDDEIIAEMKRKGWDCFKEDTDD